MENTFFRLDFWKRNCILEPYDEVFCDSDGPYPFLPFSGCPCGHLVDRRGEDFHRWRAQTHGIQGVPRKSPWHHDATSRTLGIGTPIYEEAKGLAAEVARIADAYTGYSSDVINRIPCPRVRRWKSRTNS